MHARSALACSHVFFALYAGMIVAGVQAANALAGTADIDVQVNLVNVWFLVSPGCCSATLF